MTKEDLKVDEIYGYVVLGDLRIFKFKGYNLSHFSVDVPKHRVKDFDWEFTNPTLRITTSKEKHWYLMCEQYNAFIPYDQAMLSFNNGHIMSSNKITPKLVKIWNRLLNKKNYYEKE